MTIDKSWISLRDRASTQFTNGLKQFLEIAKNHVNGDGEAYCPCKKCHNRTRKNTDIIWAHVIDNGFTQSYKTWYSHGEEHPNVAAIKAISNPYIDTSGSSATHPELFDAIHDVMDEQNTHEENVDEDGTGLDPEFDDLFKELNTELYPGCTWMSSLNFLAKLMHIKVINKWTNSSFDQLVEFLRVAFPKENHIPTSYYEAKKKLRKIGLGYESIDACINDCALFWKENASMQNCPVCKESRWVDKNTNGKKVPKKVLHYL